MSGRFDHNRPIDIRRIGPQSAQDCATIHAQAFPHPWSGTEFEALLAGRDVLADAAMMKSWGRPTFAGFVLSRMVAGEAEILTIAVAAKFRRRGIGSALLSAHLPSLAAKGTKALFLEVEAGNHAALALYKSFGFRQVGERKAYYRKPGAPNAAALVLRLDFA